MKVQAVTPFIVDPGYGKNWLFVKVETSDGLHGWGECYTQADRDQSIVAHVRQLARYLIGRDAIRIAESVDHPFTLATAHAGIGALYVRRGDFEASKFSAPNAPTAGRHPPDGKRLRRMRSPSRSRPAGCG